MLFGLSPIKSLGLHAPLAYINSREEMQVMLIWFCVSGSKISAQVAVFLKVNIPSSAQNYVYR